MNFNNSILSSSVEGTSVSVGWDSPTDNGGRDDLTYTVTISPPAQLSATVVTSTSVTVSAADYNEDYTVSVVATNCAGNSTAEVFVFRVGESSSFSETAIPLSHCRWLLTFTNCFKWGPWACNQPSSGLNCDTPV